MATWGLGPVTPNEGPQRSQGEAASNQFSTELLAGGFPLAPLWAFNRLLMRTHRGARGKPRASGSALNCLLAVFHWLTCGSSLGS